AARGKTNLGVVKVPDARVDALSKLYSPKKTTYAEITFSDVAASAGGGGSARGLDRGGLSAMREGEALCQVVRGFHDETLGAPAPLREIQDLEAEMILGDLELVEKRLERLKKEKGKPREQETLEKLKVQLDGEKPLRLQGGVSDDEWNIFSGFRFL